MNICRNMVQKRLILNGKQIHSFALNRKGSPQVFWNILASKYARYPTPLSSNVYVKCVLLHHKTNNCRQ